jgi:hypothetical protein
VEDYTYKVKQRAYLSEQVPDRREVALAKLLVPRAMRMAYQDLRASSMLEGSIPSLLVGFHGARSSSTAFVLAIILEIAVLQDMIVSIFNNLGVSKPMKAACSL